MANRTIFLTMLIFLSILFEQQCTAAVETAAVETGERPVTELQSSRRIHNTQREPIVAQLAATHTPIIASPIRRTLFDRDMAELTIKRGITALACIATLCFAVVFYARMQLGGSLSDKTTPLRLISTLKIAPRCCLTLVSVNGREFLITRDAAGVKNIVPISRSFDSYVADSLTETGSRIPSPDPYVSGDVDTTKPQDPRSDAYLTDDVSETSSRAPLSDFHSR